jgi:putative transposase
MNVISKRSEILSLSRRDSLTQPRVGRQRRTTLGNATTTIPTLTGLFPAGARTIVPAMSQSLAKILVHTVFSTKERKAFLKDHDLRTELHAYIGGVLKNHDCQPIIVGGVADHVHLLFALARTRTAADIVKETKRASSLWIKTRNPELRAFAWQSGYGVFSIGASQIETVREYIARQEEHHGLMSFQEEFRLLLTHYEIAFDERYVWD